MRYTIGYSDKNKISGKTCENRIYALSKYGLGFLLNPEKEPDENALIYVSEDINEIKKLVTILSNCYRRDDVWHSDTKKSKLIRHFYPVKIDSSNFPYVIKKEPKHSTTVNGRKDGLMAKVDLYHIASLKNK